MSSVRIPRAARSDSVAEYRGQRLISSPVDVPADFAGMHAHRWPTARGFEVVSPAPVHLQVKTFRQHDSHNKQWRHLNPSDGVYDWALLDASLAAWEGAGVGSYMYTIYGTPTWAATPSGQTHQDPYGNYGGADRPADMSKLAAFVTALVTRYNTGGSRRIKYLEIWNEPGFAQNWTGFFWGSAVDMVEMAETVRAAAKAVDPGIVVISPAFTGTLTTMDTWLGTYSSAVGKHGRQTFDAVSWHPYTAQGDGSAKNLRVNTAWGIERLNSILVSHGVSSVPKYISEYGTDSSSGAAFAALDAQARKRWMERVMALAAVLGVAGFYVYSYDGSLSGDYINDADGVIAAFNRISATLCGKTISFATQRWDGALYLTVDGVTHVF